MQDQLKAYKLYLDTADYSVPISDVLKNVKVHGSRVAIPLTRIDVQGRFSTMRRSIYKVPGVTWKRNVSEQVKCPHRLTTRVGSAGYVILKQTVEPVFGIIKSVMGFR